MDVKKNKRWACSWLSCSPIVPSSVMEIKGSYSVSTVALSQGRICKPNSRHWRWSSTWRLDHQRHTGGHLDRLRCDVFSAQWKAGRGHTWRRHAACSIQTLRLPAQTHITDHQHQQYRWFPSDNLTHKIINFLHISGATLVTGLPDESSSTRDILLILKRPCNSKHCVQPIAPSP